MSPGRALFPDWLFAVKARRAQPVAACLPASHNKCSSTARNLHAQPKHCHFADRARHPPLGLHALVFAAGVCAHLTLHGSPPGVALLLQERP
jgi:hypothetical protein